MRWKLFDHLNCKWCAENAYIRIPIEKNFIGKIWNDEFGSCKANNKHKYYHIQNYINLGILTLDIYEFLSWKRMKTSDIE